MDPELQEFILSDRNLGRHLIVTLLILLFAVGARILIVRFLRAQDITPQVRRRWIASTRNALLVVTIGGIGTVWATELQTIALSLVAVAAAIVLATKELLLCVSGAFVRTISRAFEIGDRIEVGGVRGDVIDTNLFATTVLEIGPRGLTQQQTGRAVVLPNALFLSSPIINETYTQSYVLHTFTVFHPRDESWKAAEATLHQLAQEKCAPHLEKAQAHFVQVAKQKILEAADIQPRVTVQLDSDTKISFVVRIPVRARDKGRVEQDIVRGFLEAVHPAHVPDEPAQSAAPEA